MKIIYLVKQPFLYEQLLPHWCLQVHMRAPSAWPTSQTRYFPASKKKVLFYSLETLYLIKSPLLL